MGAGREDWRADLRRKFPGRGAVVKEPRQLCADGAVVPVGKMGRMPHAPHRAESTEACSRGVSHVDACYVRSRFRMFCLANGERPNTPQPTPPRELLAASL